MTNNGVISDLCFRGHSRSLKVAPVNRSYTTSYHSVTVTIALSCTNAELFNVENIVTKIL